MAEESTDPEARVREIRRKTGRRTLLFLSLIAGMLFPLIVWFVFPRGPLPRRELLAQKGDLSRVSVLDRFITQGMITEELLLESTSGLEVRALIQSPEETGSRHPAVLLLGGMRTGRNVILHVPKNGPPAVWMSIDYLYQRPPSFPDVTSVLSALPEAKRGAEETLSAVCLALDYLESRANVDKSRTVLAGGSLGAFVAVVCGAMDPRFEGVASLYGGGNLVRIVEANLPWRSPWLRATTARALNPWLGPVDPIQFVSRISPRPFLMLNGSKDARIPRECVLDLYREAHAPKDIVWLDTPHRIQDELDSMAQATEVVLEWMEAQGWFDP